MIRKVKKTTQFKKDFKRIRHDAVLKSEVLDVASRLAADVLLPDKYCDHALHNNWEWARDCHIRPDVVLIYRKYEDVLSILRLERLGSHSELGL